MNLKKINRALISVSDKSELSKILKVLKKFKVEILSSGGTYKKINRLGYKSIEISDFTNSPEILDGRVKTLHPKLYGGILFKRNNKKHQKQIKKIDIRKIDLVIVNFYPFEEAVKTGNDRKIIENNLTSIPNKYKNSVEQIIKICSDNDLSCIFLENPTAYNNKVSNKLKKNFWQTPPNANYSINLEGLIDISIQYNNWLKEVVEKNNFLFCETNKFLEPTEKNFYDDSHLNPQGSKKFSEIVYKCLNSTN